MTKVTLANVGSIIDATTAQTTLNSNNAAIVTAVENTLSRDGTSPNQMNASLDMNSNRILNLPAPTNNTEPLRLQDQLLINTGGVISSNPLPVAGTVGQALTKNSSTNYDVSWQTPSLVLSAGQVTGATTASNTIDNSNLVTALPTTLKGNPTSAGANVQDFSITGLVNSTAPDANSDFLLIHDSATSTFKKVNGTTLLGTITSGITSIDAQTGVFTTGNGLSSPSKVIGLSAARRTLPTRQTFPTATSSTYVTPANCIRISVRMVGGGGGGGATGGAGLSSAGGGGISVFNSVNANGGSAGNGTGGVGGGTGGAGGTGGTGTATYRTPGKAGGTGAFVNINYAGTAGGIGGDSILGMGGTHPNGSGVGPGGGGGGGQNGTSTYGNGGGGGGGEYVELNINNPAATYSYTVGATGLGGGAGSGGNPGAIGFQGIIIVDEYYGS